MVSPYLIGKSEEDYMTGKDLCLHCGGSNIQKMVEIRTTQNRSLGPRSKGPFGIFSAGSYLFCDICRDCGTLIRIYVNDPDKEFVSGDDTGSLRFVGD